MKSPNVKGIGEVVTEYGAKVMKIFKKGLLGRSLFDFYGDIKAQTLRTKESSSAPNTPVDGDGGVIYTKSADGKLYYKSNEVSEVELSSQGTNTTYSVSCVDGDNSDEEKIRLTGSDSSTDDVVLEAGTGLSIARDGDKITFTNTVTDTDTVLTTEQVQDIAGALVATGGTKTGISVTYDDDNNNMDFVVDHNAATNYVANEHLRWDTDVASTATIHTNNITDLHGAGVDGSANQILTDDGDGTVTSESGLTYDSSSDTLQLASTSAGFPRLEIKSNANTTSGQRLTFIKDRGTAPSDGDTLGIIRFEGEDSGQNATFYAQMFASIATAANGSEGGKITFQVASHDGEAVSALEIIDGNAEDEVDVNIASGTSSLTTIAGNLQVSGNEIKDDDGFTCITFDSSGNTIIGTLDGDNGGDLIANRVLVKDTDESPSAQLALVDNDDNNIAQLARIGSGANAHIGQLVLRDNATAKVQIKASGSSYINASSAKLGIGNNSPTKELDVTGDTAISGDLTVGGNVTISGNLRPLGEVKILPSDFIADDVGRPLMIDDTSSDRFLESHSTAKMYASINIPVGAKATQVIIYGSGTSAITVYEADVDSKTVTSKGTGNIGTLLNFTDITGDATNYVLIELAQASGEEVYGGKLTIA